MRLKKYIINEITKPTINKSIKLIEKKLYEFYRILEKRKWKVNTITIINILNGLFKKDWIGFEIDEGRSSGNFRKYVTSGVYDPDNGGITLFINKSEDVGKFFRRFSKEGQYEVFFDIKKNAFLKELNYVMSHELLHMDQYKNRKGKDWVSPPSPISRRERTILYLSDKDEIETHAQTAAMDILSIGTSPIMKQYFDFFKIKDDVMKKFLKKVTYYVEISK